MATARVVLVTGVAGELGSAIAGAVLAAGGKVAAPVARPWQVERARAQLGAERLLVGLVAPGDGQAAAGFVKGAVDALGAITDLVAASLLMRGRDESAEPRGDLDELLDANLHANAVMTRALLPSLRRRGHGRLAFARTPDDASELSVTCRASLAAVDGYAAALAAEFEGGPLEVVRVEATSAAPEAWL